MKRFLSSVGLMVLALPVRAHDSLVPHTHQYASNHSDLFILGLAALACGAAVYVLIRLWCRNRQAKVSSLGKGRR
jgi:hypothetical protein